MFSDAFAHDHQLLKTDPKHSLYLACGLIVRGNVEMSDIRRNIDRFAAALCHLAKDEISVTLFTIIFLSTSILVAVPHEPGSASSPLILILHLFQKRTLDRIPLPAGCPSGHSANSVSIIRVHQRCRRFHINGSIPLFWSFQETGCWFPHLLKW